MSFYILRKSVVGILVSKNYTSCWLLTPAIVYIVFLQKSCTTFPILLATLGIAVFHCANMRGKKAVILFYISLITNGFNTFFILISHLLVFFSELPIQTSCFPPPTIFKIFNGFIKTHCLLSILTLCHILLILSPVCHFSFLSLYEVFCSIIHLSFYVVKYVFFFIIAAFDVLERLTIQNYKNMRLHFFLMLLWLYFALYVTLKVTGGWFSPSHYFHFVVVVLFYFIPEWLFNSYYGDWDLFSHHLFQTGYYCFKGKQLIV